MWETGVLLPSSAHSLEQGLSVILGLGWGSTGPNHPLVSAPYRTGVTGSSLFLSAGGVNAGLVLARGLFLVYPRSPVAKAVPLLSSPVQFLRSYAPYWNAWAFHCVCMTDVLLRMHPECMLCGGRLEESLLSFHHVFPRDQT